METIFDYSMMHDPVETLLATEIHTPPRDIFSKGGVDDTSLAYIYDIHFLLGSLEHNKKQYNIEEEVLHDSQANQNN